MNQSYLTLIIGNSRLHWAWFVNNQLQATWDTNHLPRTQVEQLTQHGIASIIPAKISPPHSLDHQLPLYIASVVTSQTQIWQTYPTAKLITLADLPLAELYSSLGIDRALAILGAGETYGYPILVIDAGTALTFTGADVHHSLVGGAILPGLGLQLQSLAQKTAALPAIKLPPPQLPSRWAKQTSTAIESGIIYTILAGIRDFITDWQSQFPDSQITVTGGDARLLAQYLQAQYPETASVLIIDPHLIFWGMASIVSR